MNCKILEVDLTHYAYFWFPCSLQCRFFAYYLIFRADTCRVNLIVPTHTWHAVPSTIAVSSAMLFRCFECIVTLSRVHSWHCSRPPALFIIKCTSHKGRDDLCKCLVMAADSWSEGSLCWTITEHRVKVLSVIVSSYIIQCNLLKLTPASCFFF